MRETAFFYLVEVEVDLFHLVIHLFIVDVDEINISCFAVDDSDVLVLQINHLVGVFNDRGGVGTQEEFVLANSHNEWTTLAGSDDFVWIILVEQRNGIRSNHLMKSHTYCGEQVGMTLQTNVFDELNNHFSICVAFEFHTFCHESLLQRSIIFDDAVVDDGKIS